ncbi:DUF1289 domain-containing protein [Thalassotalea sp. SU-HH00458]|uniref:DUF1289 domain-containing protein n=1 Tax=Thalassotalea sp. SU-HH00458 TaxID=3127657 RepID=UPI0033653234
MNTGKKNITTSPCVRNCCLNDKDVCLGCFRHINEIIGWQSFTEQEKLAILVSCTNRKIDHESRMS